jgi:hypothetical protein
LEAKVVNTLPTETPACLAISRIVVPWKPWTSNRSRAAMMTRLRVASFWDCRTLGLNTGRLGGIDPAQGAVSRDFRFRHLAPARHHQPRRAPANSTRI